MSTPSRTAAAAPPAERVEAASTQVTSSDWDEVSALLSEAYFPHTLTPVSPRGVPDLLANCATLGPIRLARMEMGADVTVDSEHPGGYAINVPLSGQFVSVTRGIEVVSTVGQATVCPPDTATSIVEWNRECEILGIRIERQDLDREIARVDESGSRLPLQLDLRTPEGASWIRLVHSLAEQLGNDSGLLHNPLVADQLAGAVTTALVLAATPTIEAPAPRPRIVKRVLDAMHADPGRPWTAGDMAECAGVGIRRLQEGFRTYVGRSPSECLLDIRLERAHADLLHGEPRRTVTDIALRWGFTHTGRFAAAYRARYGRSPSQSLRG
ncbi:AraC family transcriptional regulator [Rhodococcus sp. NPDC003318]|uniref:AraC family transcriptional regulator n=1 Tax=Rhodococcus sp. NPDC003318 TaxID=3364503 RepID=UPI0036B92B16